MCCCLGHLVWMSSVVVCVGIGVDSSACMYVWALVWSE